MTEWRWFEVHPPWGTTLADTTAVMRVMSGRPAYGVLKLRAVVVFELWLSADRARWLVGADERIADTLPGELQAQQAGLVVVPLDDPQRPVPITGRELRFRSSAYQARLDSAVGVTAGLLRIRDDLRSHEDLVVQWVIGPSHSFTDYPKSQTPLDYLGFTEPAEPDSIDQQAWRRKLSESLYGVRGRTGARAADLRRAARLTRSIFSALSLVNDRHAHLQVSRQSTRVAGQISKVMGRTRTWSSVINSAELAVLVGWNVGELDLPGLRSTAAAPPKSFITSEDQQPSGRRLGASTHPGVTGSVVLPLDSYNAHLHLVGPPGVGKSTLLAQWVLDEATAGRSVVVVEPKGDLVQDVLQRLPADRHDDLVVIDPGAATELPVVGFNPLAGPRADAERRADSLLHLFRELFGNAIGPRSADVLLHALIMAARLPDGALTDVLPILSIRNFRRRVVQQVGDPLVITPWALWFDNLSDAERSQVIAPVANKLRMFSSRPSLRRMLSQGTSSFSLDEVFRTPRVVLINLNAGAIGPEASAAIGSLILNQLWEAIQRQTTKPAVQRRPVPVVVDEWQSWTAGLDFADVLARARGAKVPFTVAHQHLDQLTPNLKAAVMANARSRVVFRPAEGDVKPLAAALGQPITPDALERLPAYHAVARVLVDGAPCPPFEVATPALSKPINDPAALHRASAARYGVLPAELDSAIQARWQGTDHTPDAPIGMRRKKS
jgi:hypothetical protein